MAACAAVERALAHGAAVAAQTPILTAVNPAVAQAREAFAGSLAEYLPADRDAIEDWWKRHVANAWPTAAE